MPPVLRPAARGPQPRHGSRLQGKKNKTMANRVEALAHSGSSAASTVLSWMTRSRLTHLQKRGQRAAFLNGQLEPQGCTGFVFSLPFVHFSFAWATSAWLHI